jgi:hypothetical protein
MAPTTELLALASGDNPARLKEAFNDTKFDTSQERKLQHISDYKGHWPGHRDGLPLSSVRITAMHTNQLMLGSAPSLKYVKILLTTAI